MGEIGESKPKGVKPVEGQCGTCKNAAKFGFAHSPSGPEDGVHCNSQKMAEFMDWQTDSGENIVEFKLNGFLDLFRLEVMADESHKCPNWVPTEDVHEQLMPAPDEAPLTMCPWCGEEYNVKTDDSEKHYQDIVGVYSRHKNCGKLVAFQERG